MSLAKSGDIFYIANNGSELFPMLFGVCRFNYSEEFKVFNNIAASKQTYSLDQCLI
jgi:hypothetical protein